MSVHRSKRPGRLEYTAVPTSTVLWWSDECVECGLCQQPILDGELFTKALAEGHGRRVVPQCRSCRPFYAESRRG